MIASRGKKKEEPAPPSAKPADPVPSAPAPPAPEDPDNLTSLIGKALKFTQKPPAKAAEAPVSPPAAAPAVAAPPAQPSEPPKKAPAKARKATPETTVDPATIASAAATAATEAVLRSQGVRKEPEPPNPAADLKPDDRSDYEVAMHMAQIDPKYKDAPRIILEQVGRAEDYAARWEEANPGKVFDPNSEDHDEFFATQARPWTNSEFEDAKIDMLADRKIKKLMGDQNSRMEQITEDSARVDLAPVVDNAFRKSAATLAKLMGDDIHETVTKGGFDALDAQDPVMAHAITATLAELHPFIEAAIQIDDPRRRIRIDPSNPAHQNWNEVVLSGEARCAGQKLPDGRLFAKRSDFVRMNEAQQKRHWFLTSDMIIQGALEYAAEMAKKEITTHKERLEKMGYVRKAAPAAPASGAPATQSPPSTPAPAPAEPVTKPVSPTAGGGVKIDDSAGKPKTSEGALMEKIHETLFRK